MARLIKLCSICVVALLMFSMMTIAYADGVPDAVKKAAEKGLPDFLSMLTDSDLEDFGFRSAKELGVATLGEPYRVYTVMPASLESYGKSKAVSSLLLETTLWYFPVLVDGKARTLLVVDFLGGQWQATEIGGTFLPQALQSLEAQLPTLLKDRGVNGTYSTKFVRIPPIYANFVVVESSKGDFIVPLFSFPEQYGIQKGRLYTAEEIMPKLADSMQRVIESEGEIRGGAVASAPEVDDGKTAIYMLAFGGVVLVGLTIGLLKARKVF